MRRGVINIIQVGSIFDSPQQAKGTRNVGASVCAYTCEHQCESVSSHVRVSVYVYENEYRGRGFWRVPLSNESIPGVSAYECARDKNGFGWGSWQPCPHHKGIKRAFGLGVLFWYT